MTLQFPSGRTRHFLRTSQGDRAQDRDDGRSQAAGHDAAVP